MALECTISLIMVTTQAIGSMASNNTMGFIYGLMVTSTKDNGNQVKCRAGGVYCIILEIFMEASGLKANATVMVSTNGKPPKRLTKEIG